MASAEPDANLSFDWTFEHIKLDVHPGAGGHWPNLPVRFQQDLDAVVDRKDNGKIYMFKDGEYLRFSNVASGVDGGYPKPIAGNWTGLPASFEAGIDAAFYRESNDKLYMFKGSEYVRLTGATVDADYPKPIAGNWRGLPPEFEAGIDAAVWRRGNGKIYFFKGGQYVRIGSDSSMDADYPQPLTNWGIPDGWEDGIDAALMRGSNDKLYFFRGYQYIRFKSTTELDPGYPFAIANDINDRSGRKDAREPLWRNPALEELGFDGSWDGVTEYAHHLRNSRNAQWSVIGFFTRYPLRWIGYAGRPRTVMAVEVGSWGMDNIDRVFAHEVGHIFGAPDEYDSSGCNCGGTRGFFRRPNGNCSNCSKRGLIDDSGYPKSIHPAWEGLPTGWRNNFDAALMRDNGHEYFFKGSEYIRMTDGVLDDGYPKSIHPAWGGLPTRFRADLDAALMRDNGKVYFFKGSEYVRMGSDSSMDDGYPKPIEGNWQGLPRAFQSDLDAALMRTTNNRVYFFKGGDYVRIGRDSSMDSGYPRPIAGNWPTMPAGFASGIQAAFERDNKKIYFFDGGQFVRFTPGVRCIMKSNSWDVCDWTPGHFGWEAFMTGIDAALWRLSNDRMYLFSGPWFVRLTNQTGDGPESGYPTLIGSNWRGLPADFRSGIDAALMRESNGKVYFFKGDQYVRIGDDSRVEAGYPKRIGDAWRGLPADFQRDIDAALYRDSNNKIYFFKGSRYVRIGADSSMDPGYPKPISGNWPGLPSRFTAGFDAALMRWGNGKIYAFKGREYVRWSRVANGIDAGYPRAVHGAWMAFPT